MLKAFKTSEIISCDTCKRTWEVIKSDILKGTCGKLAGGPIEMKLSLCSNCMGRYCTGCFDPKRNLCCECVDITGMRNEKAS
jgi:hypothetical protein